MTDSQEKKIRIDDSQKSSALEHFSARPCMLIEDNPLVRSVIKMQMEICGFSVKPFESADSAIDYFLSTDEQLSFVLSDICMPGQHDGISLANVLRNKNPNLPIILMSGFHQTAIPSFVLFIEKPFSMNIFWEMLVSEELLEECPNKL